MGALRICGNGLFALLYLRPQNEVLGFKHLGDRRLHFTLDGGVLRLKIEQWNIHSWLLLSLAGTIWFPRSTRLAMELLRLGRGIAGHQVPLPYSDSRLPGIASLRTNRVNRGDGRAGSSIPPGGRDFPPPARSLERPWSRPPRLQRRHSVR